MLTVDLLRVAFPPRSRLLARGKYATVEGVGIFRECGVVYVTWDNRPGQAGPHEVIVASAVRLVSRP